MLRPTVRGADAVARVFVCRAELARVAVIDGLPGAVFAPDGIVQAAYVIRFGENGIVGVEVVGEPSDLVALRIAPPAAAAHPGS